MDNITFFVISKNYINYFLIFLNVLAFIIRSLRNNFFVRSLISADKSGFYLLSEIWSAPKKVSLRENNE